MEFDITILRANIRSLCQEKGISINAMAENIGVRYSTISNMLLGRSNNPSIQLLWKIADYFGITIDELIGHSCSSLDVSQDAL